MRAHRFGVVLFVLAYLFGSLIIACNSDSGDSKTDIEPLDSKNKAKNAEVGDNAVNQTQGKLPTPTPLAEIPVPTVVPDGLEPIWEAYGLLMQEYINRTKLEPETLAEAAIRGMVDSIEDRYTAYILVCFVTLNALLAISG